MYRFLACLLPLTAGQLAPTAAPPTPSGLSTDCVKQADSNPCPRPYFYDFTPVGNFAFFSCGSDGYARCRYNPTTATVVPGSCQLLASPCGLEAVPKPTYDFASVLGKYAFFSCDVDYYRCTYDPETGTAANCTFRPSPCPLSVESFFSIGNSGYFSCSQDGYYQCDFDQSTGFVNLQTCVQKASPCAVTHDVSITPPFAYFSCAEGGFFTCPFDATNQSISTRCTRSVTPCGGVVKRTYSFTAQGSSSFFDCFNDGYYKCKYNTPPLWSTTGPCQVAGTCVSSSNYPAEYGNNETCIITPLASQMIHFDDFSTENNYDVLTINNVSYSGRNKPPDLNVSTPIRWRSDESMVFTGWKFCGVVPPTPASPTAPSTQSPSSKLLPPTLAPSSVAPSSVAPSSTVPTSTAPSAQPTSLPTSLAPTAAPSLMPTMLPTYTPTLLPSSSPTAQPTLDPTAEPTTTAPTSSPTSVPTTRRPTTRAPTPVQGDMAGTVISVLLIIGLVTLLAISAFCWWRKSRKSATISPANDPPTPPEPASEQPRSVPQTTSPSGATSEERSSIEML